MKRLLVISPDPETAEVLSLSFELADFEVECAQDVADGRRSIVHAEPDVCIIELCTFDAEVVDGLKRFLLSTTRKRIQTFLLVPFVPGGKEEPILHAHHVLKKPYDLTTLVNMVRTISNPKRSSSSRRGQHRQS